MAQLAPLLRQQFTDANGIPLVGGKIYSYQAGTTTPLATYTDSTGSTPNANPVILDSNGQAAVWVGPATYKFVVTTSSDVVLFTDDNVHAANPDAEMPSGGSAGQVLTKSSGSDFAAQWQTPSAFTSANQVRSGSGIPSSGTGIDGDFYIDTSAHTVYGPKAAGAWGSSTSLIGAAGTNGSNGSNGSNGTNGANGNTVLNGSGAPSSGVGVNGDFYIDTTAWFVYGPKAAGSWPSGVSMTAGAGAAPTITGSRASPSNVVAGTGIVFAGSAYNNIWFVQGSGGAVTVSANPQISAGSSVGQRLKLIQRSATNTLTFADGNGLDLLGGALVLSDVDKSVEFLWDGTNWVLQY